MGAVPALSIRGAVPALSIRGAEPAQAIRAVAHSARRSACALNTRCRSLRSLVLKAINTFARR